MILAISGKKGSGKDTVCKIIQYLTYAKNELRYRGSYEDYWQGVESGERADLEPSWERKLFADKLKDIVCLLIGCTREQLEDQVFKETPLGEEWVKWEVIDRDPEGYGKTYFLTEKDAKDSLENNGANWLAYDPIINKIEMTPRLLLQLLGTECGRQIIHPNIWVNALMSEYKSKGGFYIGIDNPVKVADGIFPDWIITDLRFPNEAKAIVDRGGFLIRVNRPVYSHSIDNCPFMREDYHKDKCLLTPTDTHESETALDNYTGWDAIINNSGTIEDLIVKVKDILQHAKLL